MQDIRPDGSKAIFNYGLAYDSTSEIDARLHHRSGQEVTILYRDSDLIDTDGPDLQTMDQRLEHGEVVTYKIRFSDGWEDTAFEDELLDIE